ncbi:MAG: Mrp/NBP35 family ATP-binding protein [Nitrospirae bacterium]|nr:Mrp/NBP35 family ATP-binding protein [Candidatus Manganitrophaceae bacterium]
MSQITEAIVLKALKKVIEPGLSDDIVTLDRVKNILINGNKVSLQIVLPSPGSPLKAEVTRLVKTMLQESIPDIGDINTIFPEQGNATQAPSEDKLLPGVQNIIAISSGKGGVGKSTVSVNLAVALAKGGARVGLLDADIYGPNIPLMMGIKTAPTPKGDKISPAQNHGVCFISMAFFVPEDTPMIWRGPMVHGAIQQLIRDVAWGDLDYLLIDLPPGTGDAQLSIAQLVPLTGAVIVTTPQEVALLDSKKGLAMFKKVNVPLLGIIENMSFFECPHCHEATEIFSRGGGRTAAEKLDIPFLGEIPIDPAIREGGDAGIPIIISDPDSAQTRSFMDISKSLEEQVSTMNADKISLNIIQ